MKRLTVRQRDKWAENFEKLGFTFHSMDGLYWNEGVCYEFSGEEIDHLEEVTGELHEMCLKSVSYVIDNNLFSKLSIPDAFGDLIKKSWARRDPSIYGRFDFSYDGRSEPRLLEYNADTPTSVFESSIAQWVWLEDMFPDYDQFNSIHEKLLDAFTEARRYMPPFKPVYFSCVKDHEEDLVTVEYMRDVAVQAGLDARFVFIEDIGYSSETYMFYDLDNNEIEFLFKLYPWEWIISDPFGKYVLFETVKFFEPPWKMILSNKGILPILWEMYPGHPNLLPSYFEPSKLKNKYIKKPLLSREGANISFYNSSYSVENTEGSYGAEGYIYQEARQLPCFEGSYALVGSWVVNGLAAGIGIREDKTPITKNTSKFVPHYFKP
jgi:glutathionylspermidine synthase